MSDLPTFFADTSMLEDDFGVDEPMAPSYGEIPRSSSALRQQQYTSPAMYTNNYNTLAASSSYMDQQLDASVNDIVRASQSFSESGGAYAPSYAPMPSLPPFPTARPSSAGMYTTAVASSSDAMDEDLDSSLAALIEAANTFQWPTSSTPSPFVDIPPYDTDERYMELVRQNATRYTMMPQDEAAAFGVLSDEFGAPTDEFEAYTLAPQLTEAQIADRAKKAERKKRLLASDLKRVWDPHETDKSLSTIVRRQTDLTVLPEQSAVFIDALQTGHWLEFVVFDRAKARRELYPDIDAANQFSRRPLLLKMATYHGFIEKMKSFPALYDLPSSSSALFRSTYADNHYKWLSIRKKQEQWLILFGSPRKRSKEAPVITFASTNAAATMTLDLPDPNMYYYRSFPILMISHFNTLLHFNQDDKVDALSCYPRNWKADLYGYPPVTTIKLTQDGSGVDIDNFDLQSLLIALSCIMPPESRAVFVQNCKNNGITISFVEPDPAVPPPPPPSEALVIASVIQLTRIGLTKANMLYLLSLVFGRPVSPETDYPMLTESEAKVLVPEFNALRLEQRTYHFEPLERTRR